MLNKKIIDELTLVLEQKKQEKDTFRIRALQNAIRAIKQLDFEITSGAQVKDVEGIGKGVMQRIDEILSTGKLQQTKEFAKELEKLTQLEKVIGVGAAKAKQLIEHGINTVDELRKAYIVGKIKLTKQQELGLKYFEDIEFHRIPRVEIDEFKKILKKVIKKNKLDFINFDIVGSYRREKSDSGDIDILFTIFDKKYLEKYDTENYLAKIVADLEKEGILIDTLSKGKYKYMGFGMIDKYARRIDILFIPPEEYYTAIVYFTGSQEFNIKMRGIAKSKGYKLNEHGLFEISSKKALPVNSEKEVFDLLGMDYVKPKDR